MSSPLIVLRGAVSAHCVEKCPYSRAGVPCDTTRMDHDAAWKRLFGLPVLIEHLLKGFASPVDERLDFSTLRQQPANSVDAKARQRHGDAAWRVDYDDGSGRSLAVLIEFQSTVDPSMATRMRAYAEAARERLRRQGKSDADGEVRVLPLVLYSGDSPWNALGGVAEVGVTADGEVWLPLSGNYLLLDVNRRAREDLPRDNLVAAVFELNAAETMGEMHARVRSLLDRLRGEPRPAVFDWLRLVAPRMFPQSDAVAVIASLERENAEIGTEKETMMALAKRVQEWEAEWHRQGFEDGLKQGLEQGEKQGLAAERELLRRLATRRFGTSVGDALVRHLADISDPDRLAGIGERIIDCGTGAELIEWIGANRGGADTH